MSDSSSHSSHSSQTPESNKPSSPVKRKTSAAGIEGNNSSGRPVKRRASKACQCCRSRKVRCNVTEHGAPCTNCRLDEVECIVSESRRKKKWTKDSDALKSQSNELLRTSSNVNANALHNNAIHTTGPRQLAQRHQDSRSIDLAPAVFPGSARYSHDAELRQDEHVPHSIYQTHGQRFNSYGNGLAAFDDRRLSMTSQCTVVPQLNYNTALLSESRPAYLPQLAPKLPVTLLSLNIKPLPPKIGPDEISYLEKKGALALPSHTLRNQLLRAYVEYVHPYNPLLDLCDFLTRVDRDDGTNGQVSLILFQAVMFAGSAFVDIQELRAAGYQSRKDARKDFFQRTRLLYDFDYDSDRLSLVQALLLLTYYYETPDDQKDTWHWMGVAVSVAYTIGLHRNPENSNLDPQRTKLWKRIWWSTYMRDRLIALGMRRPTRIKDQDADVPMLTVDDFDFVALPDDIACIDRDCCFARDVEKQRQLAVMCIEKARLCTLISLVLAKQYCVLNNQQGIANDRTTMMLLPRKLDPATCEVEECDSELTKWFEALPEEALYNDALDEEQPMNVHKSLLHMCYYTTLSALHRPQVLPAGAQAKEAKAIKVPDEANEKLLDLSRVKVRQSANALTKIASALDGRDLTRYLPTTGVTCLLPAIIIHLLDVKSDDAATRASSLKGFCQCMQVMGKLRDLYAAADYSVAFLEAAIRKAGIQIPTLTFSAAQAGDKTSTSMKMQRPKLQRFTTIEDLVNAGRAAGEPAFTMPETTPATPPPEAEDLNADMMDVSSADFSNINPDMLASRPGQNVTDAEVAARLGKFLASTPPSSDGSDNESTAAPGSQTLKDFGATSDAGNIMIAQNLWSGLNSEFDESEFDNLLNLDAVGGESFTNFEGNALQGESSGFAQDMDWMKVLA